MKRSDNVYGEMKVTPHGFWVLYSDHQAALDAVLDKAVMYAQWLVQITDGESDENQDARDFLASPAVRDYRARQEQG